MSGAGGWATVREKVSCASAYAGFRNASVAAPPCSDLNLLVRSMWSELNVCSCRGHFCLCLLSGTCWIRRHGVLFQNCVSPCFPL